MSENLTDQWERYYAGMAPHKPVYKNCTPDEYEKSRRAAYYRVYRRRRKYGKGRGRSPKLCVERARELLLSIADSTRYDGTVRMILHELDTLEAQL